MKYIIAITFFFLLQQVTCKEGIGGTPANRMIHCESEQLFIVPYAIDAQGNKSTTATAWLDYTSSNHEPKRSLGSLDTDCFQSPSAYYNPETYFFCLGSNLSKEGMTADLEALAEAKIVGINFFHGNTNVNIKSDAKKISALSPEWDDFVMFTAKECKRLGLRFTMQNCPGWAMAGGPWITPENAMRHLIYIRTDVVGAKDVFLPKPEQAGKEWLDYRDIAVLAFPTPLDDTGVALKPLTVEGNRDVKWRELIMNDKAVKLQPADSNDSYTIVVTFAEPITVRTIEFSPIHNFSHEWAYEPGVTVTFEALQNDGMLKQTLLKTGIPKSSWQDDRPVSFALPDIQDVKKYRLVINNLHLMNLEYIHFYSAARKTSWEAEAGWTQRGKVRTNENPAQAHETFVKKENIIDVTDKMDKDGCIAWNEQGKWTILRIGHVNTGCRNQPAPPEAAGWECNKLSETGADAHFAGYIGRLVNGPLKGGLLDGMLLDSWECKTQTWTSEMEDEFLKNKGYRLRKWLPAVFGYVVDSHETTARFLLDWRSNINNLFVNRFYGRMAKHAKDNNLTIKYENAAGDIFPGDILEYYKYADIPMAEYCQPVTDSFIGAVNYNPIRPAASAVRMYGKKRLSAEAFTSFTITWDEHFSMLREVSNLKYIDGVTHLILHTYTHNPQMPFVAPGSSFDGKFGTPFLRGQTWWKYMPEFVTYTARCGYMLEKGVPVSDVLWYLGDEICHTPDQKIEFQGYKYDYCNRDVLLNRLSVRDGRIVTQEGISYSVLYLVDNERMLPETLEKLVEFVRMGAVIVGDAPKGLATLSGEDDALKRFDATVRTLWGSPSRSLKGGKITKVGKGKILSGMTLEDALKQLNIKPDVTGGNALWLHRKTDDAEWYFVTAPFGESFSGTLSFRNGGQNAEIWNPVSGEISAANIVEQKHERTSIQLELTRTESCFVVFRKSETRLPAPKTRLTASMPLNCAWTLIFPDGWGMPKELKINELKPWKDLDISPEARAFSGTAVYTATFDVIDVKLNASYILNLGNVEMIAEVRLNGKKLRTLWTSPYKLDVTSALQHGRNVLNISVTNTWFNRLVYDAGLPEAERKTWTLAGPSKTAPLRESGLLGPVKMEIYQ
jgi:hypothetical protein